MVCKYCGKNIPDEVTFCPECGKISQSMTVRGMSESRNTGTPFVLLMLSLCASTVYNWFGIIFLGNYLNMGVIINTLGLFVGVVALGMCIYKGKIDALKYRYSDLLVLFCICMIGPWLLLKAESSIVSQFGSSMAATYFLINSIIELLVQFPDFWLTLGIVLLGLGRQGDWKPSKKHILFLFVTLLIRTVVVWIFRPLLVAEWEISMEIVSIFYAFSGMYFLLYWLWPLTVLWTFWNLGSGRVGTGGAVATFIGMLLSEFLLFPIFLASLDLGMLGYGIVKGISPLFGLLILCIVTRLHRKKTGDVV